MLRSSYTGQFKEDRKRAGKGGRDVGHLDAVLARLVAEATLEPRCRVHLLRGTYAGHMERHIAPDLLLIWYYAPGDEAVFVRTGSHADLFG